MMATDEIHYRRSRFSTRLKGDRSYTAGHHWILKDGPDLWRVGFTKFAARMLGEAVELGFDVKPGDTIATGQAIGWVEGFKAVTDLYSPLRGRFEQSNPSLDSEIKLVQTDPYGRGWLYMVRGAPEPEWLDVNGYVSVLDATIDKMLGQRHESKEG
jgi:glycine cleavage system H protein